MVDRILSDACRETCELYFGTSYGWIYYRNLFNDHFDASTKTYGWNCGNGRIIRTFGTYRKNSRTDQSSVTDLRDCFTCYLIGSQKDNAQIPNGSSDDGSRSSHDTGFADERMGNQDIGCSITRTSKMEFS